MGRVQGGSVAEYSDREGMCADREGQRSPKTRFEVIDWTSARDLENAKVAARNRVTR